MVSWFVAIPVGVYSATHQYSIPDYIMSIISFIGVGVPGFLLALIFMYFAQTRLPRPECRRLFSAAVYRRAVVGG